MCKLLLEIADGSELRYTRGRGIPCYLLDRVGDDSSIYSDGASRIFVTTDSSSAIEKKTNTLASINTLTNSSLFNLSIIGSMCDSLGISDQNLFQCQPSINMSSIGSEFHDSRTTERCITLSSSNKSLVNHMQEGAREVTMLSNISAVDTYCSIPVCITKDQSQEEHFVLDDQVHSNNSKGVENMFPEYVRLLSDFEDEPRCEKNIEDSFESQFPRILNTL